jgi:hypothetical protein
MPTAPTDLSGGGIVRLTTRTYLGPSLGWVEYPSATYPITAAGTYTIPFGYALVTVNVAGVVTITLPTSIAPAAPSAQPVLNIPAPITIIDIGGNANAHPITIQPASGSENITSLASISLLRWLHSSAQSTQKGWDIISP